MYSNVETFKMFHFKHLMFMKNPPAKNTTYQQTPRIFSITLGCTAGCCALLLPSFVSSLDLTKVVFDVDACWIGQKNYQCSRHYPKIDCSQDSKIPLNVPTHEQ